MSEPSPSFVLGARLRSLLAGRYWQIVGAIVVLAIAYYFVIALPRQNRARLEFEREKFRIEQEERGKREKAQEEAREEAESNRKTKELEAESDRLYRERKLDSCLDSAEQAYWVYVKLNGTPVEGEPGIYNAPQRIWDRAAQQKKDACDECRKRWKP